LAGIIFESCHGKGAVDGVGATVKCLANDAVCQGADIDVPRKLLEDQDFKSVEGTTSQEAPLIHGTRSIHQITAQAEES